MPLTLKEIGEKRSDIVDTIEAMNQLARDEKRDLYDSEKKEQDDLYVELKKLDEDEERAKKLQAVKTQIKTRRGEEGHVDIKVGKDNREDDPTYGFRDINDMLRAVLDHGKSGKMDDRLRPLNAAGSDEHGAYTDPHGGFLIPEQHITGVLEVAPEMDPTASLVTPIPMDVSKVSLNARVDKNHSSSVSGGLTVSRTPETQAGTSSRTKVEKVKLEALALTGVAYVTDDLIEESPSSVIALIQRGFRQEMPSKIFQEKISGTGAGEFEGILNAACTVEVAKEGSQTADTINGDNIVKMASRCWGYGSAIWLANHDCRPQISKVHLGGTNSDSNLWQQSMVAGQPDMLLGRPIFFTEYAKTLGDAGDIILGCWSEYLVGTRTSGPRFRESLHVRFLERERTLQVYVKNDGRSWWKTALTPKNSSATLSPFVTLAARA